MTRTARDIRLCAVLGGALALAVPAAAQSAPAKITIARTAAPEVALIPAYVALQAGLFAKEGLEARFVVSSAKGMVTAGIRGAVDFVPNSRGGAQAALKGAALVYVVGGATIPPWALVVERGITTADDLRGRILGQGSPGGPGYGDGVRVLRDVFGLRAGRQYRTERYPAEEKRLAALRDGTIQAAMLSFPAAAKAERDGFRVLFRTGAWIGRLDGVFWTARVTLKKKRAATAGFIRAIAAAIAYLRTDRDGSARILREMFDIRDSREAALLRDLVRDAFSPDIPDTPFRAMLEERRRDLISRRQWSKDRKLPDPERFVARRFLTKTLRGLGYRLAPAPDLTAGRK